MNLAPLFFSRTARGEWLQPMHNVALGGALFSFLYALLGFPVESLGFGCAAALVGQREHFHFLFVPAKTHAQHGADADVPARLQSLPFAFHMAAFNGLLGQIAGLVEAGGPEPFVDADLFHLIKSSSETAD